ncbi:WD40-repeat-containing domain protein [Phlyctochytrium arcticum]|nr:WD40-repeat-containing domain protein [Phlyctochytrium arcticum]
MENLRTDLVRRVKMLEFALRQERFKINKLQQDTELKSSEDPPAQPVNTNRPSRETPSSTHNTLSSATAGNGGTLLNFSKGFGHMRSKEILKNYLREMSALMSGATSGVGSGPKGEDLAFGAWQTQRADILPIKAPGRDGAKVRIALPNATHFSGTGMTDSANAPENVPVAKSPDDSHINSVGDSEAYLDSKENTSLVPPAPPPLKAVPDVPDLVMEKNGAKESLRKITQDKGGNSRRKENNMGEESNSKTSSREASLTADEMDQLKLTPEKVTKFMSRLGGKTAQGKRRPPDKSVPNVIPSVVANLDGGLAALTLNEDDIGEGAKKGTRAGSQRIWRPKAVLRNHLDAIRCVQFTPGTGGLITASEDKTAKLWNIGKIDDRSKVLADIEPVCTLRGHSEPLTCVAVSADGQTCYTGSVDATIRMWALPPVSRDPYSPYQPVQQFKRHVFVGHSDIVWDLQLHPLPQNNPFLASASSDGAVKIWSTVPNQQGLRTTLWYDGLRRSSTQEFLNPTSLNWVHTSKNHVAVGYQNSVVKIFDVETGQEILKCKSDETFDGTPSKQINKVVCHTTLPLIATAHEDQYVRMFDANTGLCTHSMIAHQDAVSTLDVSPDGLTLVSGGHDCSIRWWDLSTHKCVQEYTSHRPKNEEGIWAVKYHPEQATIMASGGADGVAKLYNFGLG